MLAVRMLVLGLVAIGRPTPMQVTAASDTTPAPAASTQPPGASVIGVAVYGTKATDRFGESDSVKLHLGINDWLNVAVMNYADLKSRSTCLDSTNTAIKGCTVHPVALYLDGRELVGAEVAAIIPARDTTWLRFQLTRDAGNAGMWSDLLGDPKVGNKSFWYRPTSVSVGLAGNSGPVPTTVDGRKFALIRLHHGGFFFAVVLMGLLLIGFFFYARLTNVLRELGPDPAPAAPVGPGLKGLLAKNRKPYSLARCQMAWWFLIVVGSFLFIYLVTQSFDTVNATALALIGISATTFLSAAAVDSTMLSPDANKPDTTTQQQAGGGGAPVNQNANPPAMAPRQSKWFLPDILSDGQGQGFHRFQMAVWTVVFGGIFVIWVWRHIAMPDFSATLLGLLGISGATYVGFKIPENQNQKDSTGK